VLEQILLGVSTRGYAGRLEAGPPSVRSRGTSKSAVSRTLRGRMTAALTAQLGQRLDGLELLALFLDGVVVAGQTVIVVLGLTREGEKRPLGLRLGSTENVVVCTELLQDLLGRGLPITDRVLCVIGIRRTEIPREPRKIAQERESRAFRTILRRLRGCRRRLRRRTSSQITPIAGSAGEES
jgi:Transposase, Mutator family